MKTYRFYIDKKFSQWDRATFRIEADTYEEAEAKMVAAFDDHDYDIEGFEDNEAIDGSLDFPTPEENSGEHTEELIYSNDKYEEKTIKKNA